MTLRARLHRQLHIGSWPNGKLTGLNVFVVWVILAALLVGIVATEPAIRLPYQDEILIAEFIFGLVFLLEYAGRIFAAPEREGPGTPWQKRWRFIFSPIGLIDLVVVVVSLAPFFVANAAVLRVIRLLRIVSIMKFSRFSAAMREIGAALRERSYDLLVCATLALVLVLLGAAGLYWVEGDLQPKQFGSIPRALWWAVITLTTVGYGGLSGHRTGPADRFGCRHRRRAAGRPAHRNRCRRLQRRHATPPRSDGPRARGNGRRRPGMSRQQL